MKGFKPPKIEINKTDKTYIRNIYFTDQNRVVALDI